MSVARRVVLSVIAIAAISSLPGFCPTVASQRATGRIRVVLVGDSTVTGRLGWGHGFKLHADDSLDVVNLAANGRSSRSYLAEGRWDEALQAKGDYYLIQFGHNDEPGKGPDRETDPSTTSQEFMSRYVDDVRRIGARPILVTSLARRTFEGPRLRATPGRTCRR